MAVQGTFKNNNWKCWKNSGEAESVKRKTELMFQVQVPSSGLVKLQLGRHQLWAFNRLTFTIALPLIDEPNSSHRVRPGWGLVHEGNWGDRKQIKECVKTVKNTQGCWWNLRRMLKMHGRLEQIQQSWRIRDIEWHCRRKQNGRKYGWESCERL